MKRGCAQRAELARGAAPHGDGGTIQRVGSSFKEDFSLTPAEFAAGTAPNPLWNLKEKRPVGDPPFIRRPPDNADRKFIAVSTMATAYAAGLQLPQYPSDVTHGGQLRPAETQHPEVPGPFYSTEHMRKAEEGNLLMASKKVLPPGPVPKPRANRDISGVSLRNPELSTSYRDSFGKFGVDPRSKLPEDASQINFKASDLCAGSVGDNKAGTNKGRNLLIFISTVI